MTPLAIFLITVSAVIHAAWNLLSKQSRPTPAFFFLADMVGALCLAPLLWYYRGVLPLIPGSVWGLLVVTGVFQAVYYSSLAAAYRSGALSVVYPLARALPVLMVMGTSLALGRQRSMSFPAMAGMPLVAFGMLLLPKKIFKDWRIQDYLNLPCLFALLAAVGTTGYSLIDDEALRRLRVHLSGSMAVVPVTLIYAALEGVSTSVFLGCGVALGKRKEIGRLLRTSKLSIVATGVAIYLCYVLVLIAMAFVSDISYVVGFRQIGILLGVLAGIWILKEPRYPPKLAGAVLLFIGLFFLATG